jgi:hypothetical protein
LDLLRHQSLGINAGHDGIIGAGESTMVRWWHVSWKRVGTTLLVIFLTPLLLAGVWLLVQFQLEPWRLAHKIVTDNPGIGMVPAVLPDHSVETLSGMRIEHFGFSIQLPWKEIYRDSAWENMALVSSKNGGVITIRNLSDRLDSMVTMRLMANSLPALHAESIRTNYALTAAAMDAKPEQVKWWKTRGQNAKYAILLLMKSSFQDECHGAIYAIDSGEIRGFQQGNPSVAPYCVKLDLFDGADHHFQFKIDEYPERGPVITQAEVNAMVASLRPMAQN